MAQDATASVLEAREMMDAVLDERPNLAPKIVAFLRDLQAGGEGSEHEAPLHFTEEGERVIAAARVRQAEGKGLTAEHARALLRKRLTP